MILCWLCGNIGLLHERTMVGTSFLAQASMSRLGEINRGSPKLLHASGRSGDPRCSWASEHLAQATTSRLSETLQPERGAGRDSVMFDRFPWPRMVNACLDLSIVLKLWDKWVCMSGVIHDLWIMGLAWALHGILLKWLVLKWHGKVMSWNSIFMDGVWWVGMCLTWNMKGIGFKGWPNEYILAWCVLLGRMIMFGLC